MKCCMDHNIPKECINEEIESVQKDFLNNTHRYLKIVQSIECVKYNSILRECKLECIGMERGKYQSAALLR